MGSNPNEALSDYLNHAIHQHRDNPIYLFGQGDESGSWISEEHIRKYRSNVDILLKMEKLVEYTPEEINTFLNSLNEHDKYRVTLKVLTSTIHTMISKKDIENIFKKEKGEGVETSIFSIDLLTFLFKVPLVEVPLYLNSFPDFARWRLRIGK